MSGARTSEDHGSGAGFSDRRPPTAEGLRSALYDGALLRLPPSPGSRALLARATALLEAELGPAPREAHLRMTPSALFSALGRVRRALYLAPEAHREIAGLLADHGLDPREYAIDPARLRVVHPRGELEPAAAAVYAVHRDTWYGHPPALITWWIPLDDLPPEQTFVFWPERLGAAVENDSEAFDYEAWVAKGWSLKIGWQDPEAGKTARYPAFLGDRAALGPGVGFACQRGESLLFAGAHLHGTRAHAAPLTRFSLDLRVVHLGDAAAGRGAPRVDDRSRGSSLGDYVRLGPLWAGEDPP